MIRCSYLCACMEASDAEEYDASASDGQRRAEPNVTPQSRLDKYTQSVTPI